MFLLSHVCLPKLCLRVPQIPPIKRMASFSCNGPKGRLAHLWNPSPVVSWELVSWKNLRPVKTRPSFSMDLLTQGTDFSGNTLPPAPAPPPPHSENGASH